ncbi:MAG: nucleoside triphosphate pyrophosphohydrolase [Chloroflexi bacterium]|nr:nucleoside triphosphate pyrophosphohydrolase [Chloroflexota bacterium]
MADINRDEMRSFENLVRIVAHLRGPDGCPWDRAQTHQSIKPHLLEETYEVLHTLDEEDLDNLCEELGDLLMQILLHAQMAAEAQRFDIGDVIQGIADKLVRRHPHVFGEASASTPEEVLVHWEAVKGGERKDSASLLDGVPPSMPALACSQAIQERASRVGFDWPGVEGVMDKLVEEVAELKEAQTPEERVREWGDILFTLANLGRWTGIDLEEALRLSNARFRKRFAYMESECRQRGLAMGSLSLGEMEALWQEAKKQEENS